MKKIGQILQAVWIWVSGKYKHVTSEQNIDASIKAVNVIKTLSNSAILSWLVSLTNTGIDNRILAVIQEKVPKVLASLQLLKNLPEHPTQTQIYDLLNSFLKTINEDETARERLLTSLAAELLVALEDNKLTFGEAAAVIEKYYQNG